MGGIFRTEKIFRGRSTPGAGFLCVEGFKNRKPRGIRQRNNGANAAGVHHLQRRSGKPFVHPHLWRYSIHRLSRRKEPGHAVCATVLPPSRAAHLRAQHPTPGCDLRAPVEVEGELLESRVANFNRLYSSAFGFNRVLISPSKTEPASVTECLHLGTANMLWRSVWVRRLLRSTER